MCAGPSCGGPLLGVLSDPSDPLLVEIMFDPHVEDWVRGDATRIRQVLSNFVSNAVKFTATGGIELSVVGQADGQLMFAVKDTGCGIADDVTGTLFSPFTQAEASTAARHGGTGLGLAISKKLVEMMGGTIGLRSAVGTGSTFWFKVPVEPAKMCAFQPVDPNAAAERSALAGVQILVAEDTAVNQRVLERTLGKLGCIVCVVGDGAAALSEVQRVPYDLVLMECHMPRMDGLEATRSIRALARSVAVVPIIALTASGDESDRERCIAAGMNDFLPKPFRADELVSVVKRYVVSASALDAQNR